MSIHLERDHLKGYYWLMDYGAQHLDGGRPRIMTASSTYYTVTYPS